MKAPIADARDSTNRKRQGQWSKEARQIVIGLQTQRFVRLPKIA